MPDGYRISLWNRESHEEKTIERQIWRLKALRLREEIEKEELRRRSAEGG